ncbi:hypothetical protein [Helicobacter vulpis]|uniref:hypothetical protein n=1 Tax=Helicobacter vulpis TaxID=2316076 RepID=UPI001F1D79FD|nr:hypothetical protein [Helicobacter vulpis]
MGVLVLWRVMGVGVLGFLLGACARPPSKLASPVRFEIAYQGSAVKTYWRRLGDKNSKMLVLGSNPWFFLLWRDTFRTAKPTTRMLEPGTYYLSSFEVQVGDRLLKSQTTLPRWRGGWDHQHNRPLFLAFQVKPHTPLKLPPIELAITHIPRDKKHHIQESYKVHFLFYDQARGPDQRPPCYPPKLLDFKSVLQEQELPNFGQSDPALVLVFALLVFIGARTNSICL